MNATTACTGAASFPSHVPNARVDIPLKPTFYKGGH